MRRGEQTASTSITNPRASANERIGSHNLSVLELTLVQRMLDIIAMDIFVGARRAQVKVATVTDRAVVMSTPYAGAAVIAVDGEGESSTFQLLSQKVSIWSRCRDICGAFLKSDEIRNGSSRIRYMLLNLLAHGIAEGGCESIARAVARYSFRDSIIELYRSSSVRSLEG